MIFLRFPNETIAMQELQENGFTYSDENGTEQVKTASHNFAIDVIGDIYEGGVYGNNGEVIEAPIKLNGFHVNMVGDIPASWQQYIVTPNSPSRVFFGA